MTKDTTRRTLSRRSALVAGLVASALPIVAPATPPSTDTTADPTAAVISPYLPAPRALTYRALGLPDDWEPRWEHQEEPQSLSLLLSKIAEEVWRRTREPLHHADTVASEIALLRLAPDAFAHWERSHAHELFTMAEQAALVGWALASTVQHSGDFELWTQQAMARVGLRMLSPEERRQAHDVVLSAYEADARAQGTAPCPRPANWEEGPSMT